jgi:hypothetical protein
MLEGIGHASPSSTEQVSQMRSRYGYPRFDWNLCEDLTQSDGASRLFEAVSAGILRLEMMLLIFVAGLMRQVDLV